LTRWDLDATVCAIGCVNPESQDGPARAPRPSVEEPTPIRWADAPGNVRLSARSTGLSRDSVANVSQIVTLDKTLLTERVGKLSRAKVDLVLSGIDVVLGRGKKAGQRARPPHRLSRTCT